MLTITVNGRRATASDLVPLPTGNVQSIKVQVQMPENDALWQNALIVAVFAAKTPKGSWIVSPGVIDENGQTKIPGDALSVTEADVYVGIRGTYADNREVTTNIAYIGKTCMGAGGEIVDNTIRDSKLTEATEFLSALYALVESKTHIHANKSALDSVTAAKISDWDDAASKKNTHANKSALDKLSESNGELLFDGSPVGGAGITVVDTQADLDAQADNDSVAAVLYDSTEDVPVGFPSGDSETAVGGLHLTIGDPAYNASAINAAIADQDIECIASYAYEDDSSDQGLDTVVVPVVDDLADNDYTDAGIELTADDVFLAQSCTKKYMLIMQILTDSQNVPYINPNQIISVDATHDSVPMWAIYTHEGLTGSLLDLVDCAIPAGWSIVRGVFEQDGGIYAAEPDSVSVVGGVVDINDYIVVPTSADSTITVAGTGASQIYAGLFVADRSQTKGMYVKRGTWQPIDDVDDVSLLGLREYSAGLAIRDTVRGDSIQDVPVYLDQGSGYICKLRCANGDYIGLKNVQTLSSGLNIRAITASLNSVLYSFSPKPVGGTPAGWTSNGQTVPAPTFYGFSPTEVDVDGVTYTDLSILPDKARSALRSLSQCLNTSASAMGTINIPEDAVLCMGDEIHPNRKYALTTGEDVMLPLLPVPWSEKDAQFVLYLTCTADIDLTLPEGTRIVGEINSNIGKHKLVGCWLRDAGVWSVGSVDYEVQEAQS